MSRTEILDCVAFIFYAKSAHKSEKIPQEFQLLFSRSMVVQYWTRVILVAYAEIGATSGLFGVN